VNVPPGSVLDAMRTLLVIDAGGRSRMMRPARECYQ
jgi:hypothetical protein